METEGPDIGRRVGGEVVKGESRVIVNPRESGGKIQKNRVDG